jgi:hypothetical protein
MLLTDEKIVPTMYTFKIYGKFFPEKEFMQKKIGMVHFPNE